MNLIKKWLSLFFLALFLCLQTSAQAAQKPKKADLDGDGTKESVVYYEGNKISKIMMDKNHDGKADVIVYYRNGYRSYAEIDANFDGKIDTVILYYFTGVPAMISVDRNGDGKPDQWTYFKNGIIYKREWDRNFDGIPDYRILFSTTADYRTNAKTHTQSIVKQYDDNFDGIFEKTVNAQKKTSAKRLAVTVGSLSEERV